MAEDKVQPPAPEPPEPPSSAIKKSPPSSVIKELPTPNIQPTKPSKGRGQTQKEPSTPEQV